MTTPAWDAVFLDRDGTINVSAGPGRYILTPDQLELLPGAAVAIGRLCAAGVAVFVVTNQRGVHLGLLSTGSLEAVNVRLRELLLGFGAELAEVLVCPHGDGECGCRKPADGLLRQAFDRYPDLDPLRCAIVGDSSADVRAGDALGLTRVLLASADTPVPFAQVELVAKDLAEAVDALLGNPTPGRMSR